MHAERHSRHVSTLNSDTTTEVPARVVVELHCTSEAESTNQIDGFCMPRTKRKSDEHANNQCIKVGYLTRGWDEFVLVLFCPMDIMLPRNKPLA